MSTATPDILQVLEMIDGIEGRSIGTGASIVLEAGNGDLLVHVYEDPESADHWTLVCDSTEVRDGRTWVWDNEIRRGDE